MKNERKQELQTNILADWLGGVTSKVTPHVKLIGIIIVAVTAFAIGYGVMNWNSKKAAGESWQSFMAAARNADEEGFGETAKMFEGDPAGQWAKLAKANIALSAAAGEMARDPRTALKEFDTVIGQYEEIVNKSKEGTMLYERAQYGRAVANEYLAAVSPKGQSEKIAIAIGIYKRLSEKGSKAMKKAAQDNLALLESYASSDAGWSEDKPDFQPGTWLAWLAHKNYETPVNPHGANSLFPPGGSGLGGSGLGGSGLGGSGLGGSGLGGSGLGGSGLGGSGLGGSGLGGSGLGGSGLGGSGLGGSGTGTDKTGLLNEIGKGLEKGSDDKFPVDLNSKDGAKKDAATKDGAKKDGAKKGLKQPDRGEAFPTNKKDDGKKDGQPKTTTKDAGKKGTNPLNAPANKKGTGKASPKKAEGKGADKKATTPKK